MPPFPGVAQILRGRVELARGGGHVVRGQGRDRGGQAGLIRLDLRLALLVQRRPGVPLGPYREQDGGDGAQQEAPRKRPARRPPAPCAAGRICPADTAPTVAGPGSARCAGSAADPRPDPPRRRNAAPYLFPAPCRQSFRRRRGRPSLWSPAAPARARGSPKPPRAKAGAPADTAGGRPAARRGSPPACTRRSARPGAAGSPATCSGLM